MVRKHNKYSCCWDKPQIHAAAYVGDLLLQNKEHAELLQSYDERRDAAVKFIQAVRPGLRVQTAALRDPKVHALACYNRLSTLCNMFLVIVSMA